MTCSECGEQISRCGVGDHWHHVATPTVPHFPEYLTNTEDK